MATIDGLIPLIYHEKQQQGSMLCAQHALNSLLQGAYFTAPDLSEIASRLDDAEHGYLEEGAHGASANMDDTGFFSVQVLEEALKVWNLTLVRWRSEAMRPYQDHPHTQMGFILNQSQHWYSLRRFGRVSSDPALEADPGDGHWFNLNSFLARPERIGKLYLGMFLQQAEQEGYSVFAVVQRDPEGALGVPRTEADELAASIPESAAGGFSRSAAASSSANVYEGFEDEDMELQAALQASLAGGAYAGPSFPDLSASQPATSTQAHPTYPSGPSYAHAAASAAAPSDDYAVLRRDSDDELDDDMAEPLPSVSVSADPVAESMARQRAVMERMQRAQEAALQEQYEDEIARFDATRTRQTAAGGSRAEEEDEMLRRAIAESEAMAQEHASRQIADSDAATGTEEEAAPAQQPPAWHGHRMYDDEDQELQAALRASLETVPEGFRVPSPPPVIPPRLAPEPAAPASSTLQPPPIQRQPSSEFETESEAESAEPEPEQLSMEEIRRRRLARFGG
ncbi:Josephin-domain-containing protein [Trametes maxima]|nr:Josephin-domain-containing protein [Trametes maxima]